MRHKGLRLLAVLLVLTMPLHLTQALAAGDEDMQSPPAAAQNEDAEPADTAAGDEEDADAGIADGGETDTERSDAEDADAETTGAETPETGDMDDADTDAGAPEDDSGEAQDAEPEAEDAEGPDTEGPAPEDTDAEADPSEEPEAPAQPVPTPIDVQYHWSADIVSTLMAHGVIRGYEDGRFRPDHAVSRQEAAALIARMMPDPPEPAASVPYADEGEWRWSYNDVAVLYAAGALPAADMFYPTAAITRADFAGFIRGAFYPGESYGGADFFPDISGSAAREDINVLALHGIVQGSSDGGYHPDGYLTRAEAAAVLLRLTNYEIIPAVVTLPAANAVDVPYVSQIYPVYAPVGCEAVSVYMGLKSKGFAANVTLRQFLDAMPRTTSNPAKGFVGSPYVPDLTKRTRTTIYPPILAEFASAYGNVTDISGSSLFEIRSELLAGNPVAVYVTLYWQKPFYRYYNIEGQTQRLLSNNHIVLLCGYNADYGYYVADPYNIGNKYKPYFYWVSESTLKSIYDVRKQALVIRGFEGAWALPAETDQSAAS